MNILRIATVLFFISIGTHLTSELHVEIESSAGLLINGSSGKVLYSKNSTKSMYPASCTKIAFALYALKFHKDLFDTKLSASQNAVKALTEAQKSKNNFASVPSYVLETDASHMGIKQGEQFLFKDLVLATMVVSADDASNMIAEAMGEGSIEKCVEDVNHYLLSIGCKNTHFTNPHGLHHPDHVTTAEDLAIMCIEAMKDPAFREMVIAQRFKRPKTNKQEEVILKQSNRLLLKDSEYYYPAAVGVKTGRHRRAGYCLVAQAEKNGRTLISVTLHGNSNADRFKDAVKLFEAAFNEKPINKTLFTKGPQTFTQTIEGGSQQLITFLQENMDISYFPSEKPKITYQVTWNTHKLPIPKGSEVGELILFTDDAKAKTAKLYADNDVHSTFIHSIKEIFSINLLLGFFGFIGFSTLLYCFTKK